MLLNRLEISDARLVRRVLSGRRDDFGVLVERYLGVVQSIAYAYTGDRTDAEDIAQDAFIQAYRKLDTLREASKFRVWLNTIARNTARRFRDKRRGDVPVEALQETHAVSVPCAEDREMSEILWKAVDTLEDGPREVLALHYRAGKTLREIAVILDISREAAAKRIQRARDSLSETLLAQLKEAPVAKPSPSSAHKKAILAAIAATPVGWSAAAGTAAGGGLLASLTVTKLVAAVSVTVLGAVLGFWGTTQRVDDEVLRAVVGSVEPSALVDTLSNVQGAGEEQPGTVNSLLAAIGASTSATGVMRIADSPILLRGYVDTLGGGGVPGATVECVVPDGMQTILDTLFPSSSRPSFIDVGTSDEIGVFEVRAYYAGLEYMVKAKADGFAPNFVTTLVPQTSGETNLQITLEAAGVIAGHVIDEDGLPAADIQIGLRPHNVTGSKMGQHPIDVDAKGRFEYTGLPPGKYGFYFRPIPARKPYGIHYEIPVIRGPVIELKPGQRVDSVEVVVPSRGWFIAGEVRGPQGEPISDAELTCHIGSNCAQGWTDQKGRFRLERIYPYKCAGLPEQGARPLQTIPVAVRCPQYGHETFKDVPLGKDDLVLTIEKTGAIAGAVLDAATRKPVPNAKAWLRYVDRADGRRQHYTYSQHAKTWSGGQFFFSDVKPGLATVSALAEGYAQATLEGVRVSSTELTSGVEILLGPGGVITLRGDFLGNMGENRPAIEWVHALPVGVDDAAGVYGIQDKDQSFEFQLDPGHYDILLCVSCASDPEHPGDNKFHRTVRVDVVAGESTQQDVSFGGTGTVRGAVATPFSQPRRRMVLRPGTGHLPLPDNYVTSRATAQQLIGYDAIIWTGLGDSYGLGCLEAGTYTATCMAESQESGEVLQKSQVFTVGENEIAQLDFAL